jgi:hypothetical protein
MSNESYHVLDACPEVVAQAVPSESAETKQKFQNAWETKKQAFCSQEKQQVEQIQTSLGECEDALRKVTTLEEAEKYIKEIFRLSQEELPKMKYHLALKQAAFVRMHPSPKIIEEAEAIAKQRYAQSKPSERAIRDYELERLRLQTGVLHNKDLSEWYYKQILALKHPEPSLFGFICEEIRKLVSLECDGILREPSKAHTDSLCAPPTKRAEFIAKLLDEAKARIEKEHATDVAEIARSLRAAYAAEKKAERVRLLEQYAELDEEQRGLIISYVHKQLNYDNDIKSFKSERLREAVFRRTAVELNEIKAHLEYRGLLAIAMAVLNDQR